MMNWKYFVSWIPGIPIAIINGRLREFWYKQFLSEPSAHQLSTLSFSLLFGLYVSFIFPWMELPSSWAAWQLGFTWLALTAAFEFLFGHHVMGNPWERLLHDLYLQPRPAVTARAIATTAGRLAGSRQPASRRVS